MQYGDREGELILTTSVEIRALEAGRREIGIEDPGLQRIYNDDYSPPAINTQIAMISPTTLRPDYNARIEVTKETLPEAVACFDAVLCLGGLKGIKAHVFGYKRAAREAISILQANRGG